MAQYVELSMDQGSSFGIDLTVVKEDGSARNLANSTFTCSIRKSYYSVSPTANLTITAADAANGIIYANATAAVTSNIRPGRYLYDIKETTTSNTVSRLIEGIITVYPQVTK
jgi:hypothetical protein